MIHFYSPEEVTIKLKKLIKIIDKIRCEIGGAGITAAQARVIFPIVKNKKGYTIQELSEMCGVTKGFVSRTIADLEIKGFVCRAKKSQTQDRNYQIVLTPAGAQFVAAQKSQVQTNFQNKITCKDLQTFIKVINVLTASA